MTRLGIALALGLAVIGLLYAAPVFRQFPHQPGGDDVPPTGDLKSVHVEQD